VILRWFPVQMELELHFGFYRFLRSARRRTTLWAYPIHGQAIGFLPLLAFPMAISTKMVIRSLRKELLNLISFWYHVYESLVCYTELGFNKQCVYHVGQTPDAP
jgi:hypothetical protein